MRPGYRLTQAAEGERDAFESDFGDRGCTCFKSAPCSWCTHPGNPHNQAEDGAAWERDTPITREQFEGVRTLLEGDKKRTRPRIHDLYDVLCMILEREEAKTPWRKMANHPVPWPTVHDYYVGWTARPRRGGPSVMDQVRAMLREVQP